MNGYLDVTGMVFGLLTVVRKANFNKPGRTMWLCKCKCGNEKFTDTFGLQHGKTTSCGCKKTIDISGLRFGRLVVIRRYKTKDKFRRAMWVCKCDCGTEKIVSGMSLRNGDTQSCGCLGRELFLKRTMLPIGIANFNRMFGKYKRGAKNRGLSFELTEGQFKELTSRSCYYCGQEPQKREKTDYDNGAYISNGIDRIDNTKGYTIENCVPCCTTCNFAKGRMSADQFIDWIRRASRYLAMITTA